MLDSRGEHPRVEGWFVLRVSVMGRPELLAQNFISHGMFVKSFRKSQFPHKFVNSFFILVKVKCKLTDLRGGCLLQTEFRNTLCEIKLLRAVRVISYSASQYVSQSDQLNDAHRISQLCQRLGIYCLDLM